MKILVTGHDGFIGSHVFRMLETTGYEVWGYDDFSGEVGSFTVAGAPVAGAPNKRSKRLGPSTNTPPARSTRTATKAKEQPRLERRAQYSGRRARVVGRPPYRWASGNGFWYAGTQRFWTDRLYERVRQGTRHSGWMKEESPRF